MPVEEWEAARVDGEYCAVTLERGFSELHGGLGVCFVGCLEITRFQPGPPNRQLSKEPPPGNYGSVVLEVCEHNYRCCTGFR